MAFTVFELRTPLYKFGIKARGDSPLGIRRDSPETISQQVGPELQLQAQAVDAKVTAPNLKFT